MVGRDEDEYPDEVEERLVNEEYKVWKKNTPFLYGKEPRTSGTNTMERPSRQTPSEQLSSSACNPPPPQIW